MIRPAGLLLVAGLAGCGGRTPLEEEPIRFLAHSAAAGGTSAHASPSVGGHAGTSGGHVGAGGSLGADGGCPELPGPPLAPFTTPRGTGCIDATEVTNGDYAAFLASGPLMEPRPPACGSDSLVPLFGWPATEPSLPVVNVDWCDAWTYCAWAGKRLCGRGDGTPTPFSKEDPVDESEWMMACSHDGERVYPYGDTYDPKRCNGKDSSSQGPVIEAGGPCEGAFPGIYDLSGNVWEWQDDCESDAPLAACRVRGGSFMEDSVNLTCRAEQSPPRNAAYNHFGFRCCY